MAANDTPQIPESVARVAREDLNNIIRALLLDFSPRNAQGSVEAFVASLLDWQKVRAKSFELVNPDGSITTLGDTPQEVVDYRTGVVSGSAVPGTEGTCGHLRFSADRSFAYVHANTVIEIGGVSYTIGRASEADVEPSERIIPRPDQATAQSLQQYWDTGPILGWGYDSAYEHSAMDTGVFVFATSEGDIQYGGYILGSFVGFDEDDLPDSAPLNAYAFLTTSGQWWRFGSGGWADSGAALLGAVTFEAGQPTKLYSERTSEYRSAVASIPVALGLAGLTLAGFGGEDSRSRYLKDYIDGAKLLPYTVDNGRTSYFRPVASGDRLSNGGVAIPDATGENNLTENGSLDFLIWGQGIYGFHRFTPPVGATHHYAGERLAPQADIPVIPAMGRITGVHAFRRARVIGTVCRMNAQYENRGFAYHSTAHTTPAFHFFPGYLGYYYKGYDALNIRRFISGSEGNELLHPQPVFEQSDTSAGNNNGAAGFPAEADDLQRIVTRLETIKGN